ARCVGLRASVLREFADGVATALPREPAQRGGAGDLATACARTAMQAGSRALARWLANLESRPSRTQIPWQPEVTSISVPPPGEDDDEPVTERPAPVLEALPPARPTATISLHDIRAFDREPSTTQRQRYEGTTTSTVAPRFEPAS